MPRLIPPVVPPGTMSGGPQPDVPVAAGLVLRPWGEADAPAALEAFSDPDIQRWHFQRLDSIDEAHDWIAGLRCGWEAETSANWAIVDTETDLPIGRVGLTRVELVGGWGEVSYWLLPAARGRGAASQSVIALADWAFAHLALKRLELKHSVDNPASCRVAGRAGFAAEGTMSQALFHDDGWHDMHLHARLRPDG